MDSREIVSRTLRFAYPARVAHSFEPSDFIHAAPQLPNLRGEWRRISDRRWQRFDEWGNEWARVDDTSKGEVVQGALPDLDYVGSLPLPDFSNPAYYTQAATLFGFNEDRWRIGSIHGFTFSVARKMRKLDQYLQDLLLERERIRVLHDRVDELVKVQMLRMREAGADSVMIAEDWGTQTQTLVSPRLWRDEFKPRFRTLCDYAHTIGLTVFMHSCGCVTAIVPDLIEVGIDLFQFDQPMIHGIDTLRRWRDAGKTTFWCPVDIQTTLQSKNEQIIRQAARDMLDQLWRGEGGFIAGYYNDNASIGLDPTWQAIANQEFLLHGRQPVR